MIHRLGKEVVHFEQALPFFIETKDGIEEKVGFSLKFLPNGEAELKPLELFEYKAKNLDSPIRVTVSGSIDPTQKGIDFDLFKIRQGRYIYSDLSLRYCDPKNRPKPEDCSVQYVYGMSWNLDGFSEWFGIKAKAVDPTRHKYGCLKSPLGVEFKSLEENWDIKGLGTLSLFGGFVGPEPPFGFKACCRMSVSFNERKTLEEAKDFSFLVETFLYTLITPAIQLGYPKVRLLPDVSAPHHAQLVYKRLERDKSIPTKGRFSNTDAICFSSREFGDYFKNYIEAYKKYSDLLWHPVSLEYISCYADQRFFSLASGIEGICKESNLYKKKQRHLEDLKILENTIDSSNLEGWDGEQDIEIRKSSYKRVLKTALNIVYNVSSSTLASYLSHLFEGKISEDQWKLYTDPLKDFRNNIFHDGMITKKQYKGKPETKETRENRLVAVLFVTEIVFQIIVLAKIGLKVDYLLKHFGWHLLRTENRADVQREKFYQEFCQGLNFVTRENPATE